MNFSIIICTYNKQAYLKDTLDWVLKERKPGDEIVIVDDGSSDGTKNFLESLDHDNFQVRFRKDKGYTLASARNLALKTTSNDAILQLDDDFLFEGSFQDLKEIYNSDRVIVCRIDYEKSGDIIQDTRLRKNAGILFYEENLYLMTKTGQGLGYFWGPLLYSKKAANSIGNYDEDYNGNWGGEDTDFGTRFFFADFPVLFYTGVRFIQQEHEKRDTWAEEQKINKELLEKKIEEYKQQDKFSHFIEKVHVPEESTTHD